VSDATDLNRGRLPPKRRRLPRRTDRHAIQETPEQGPPEPRVSMDFRGSIIGQVGAKIANIDSTIGGVSHSGDSKVADALQALVEAVQAQHELAAEQRQDLLDNIEYLAQAAQSPPEKRSRGMVKAALEALTAAATTSTELSKVVDAWGSVLHRFVS
jgi:hypothetical protein